MTMTVCRMRTATTTEWERRHRADHQGRAGPGKPSKSTQDPRMLEQVPPGQTGDWITLGSEGLETRRRTGQPGSGRCGYHGNRTGRPTGSRNTSRGRARLSLPATRGEGDQRFPHDAPQRCRGCSRYHNNGGTTPRVRPRIHHPRTRRTRRADAAAHVTEPNT